MHTMLERKCVLSSPTPQAPTLRAVLEELGIRPFTPESVAQYKRKKMAAVMRQIQNRRELMQTLCGPRTADCRDNSRCISKLYELPLVGTSS